tara:strand:+ start:84 stop:209 length:126 start_codon:yes stop_codon:yes gene_type:complete
VVWNARWQLLFSAEKLTIRQKVAKNHAAFSAQTIGYIQIAP